MGSKLSSALHQITLYIRKPYKGSPLYIAMGWGISVTPGVFSIEVWMYHDQGWLIFTSHRQQGHLETAPPPHLLSLTKEVKLGFYTVPTRNRTPGRRVTVNYTTSAPRQLHYHNQSTTTNQSSTTKSRHHSNMT